MWPSRYICVSRQMRKQKMYIFCNFLKIRFLELFGQSYFEISRKKNSSFKNSSRTYTHRIQQWEWMKESCLCFMWKWQVLYRDMNLPCLVRTKGAYLSYCYSILWDVFVTFLLFFKFTSFTQTVLGSKCCACVIPHCRV